jgi:hypothetical protein
MNDVPLNRAPFGGLPFGVLPFDGLPFDGVLLAGERSPGVVRGYIWLAPATFSIDSESTESLEALPLSDSISSWICGGSWNSLVVFLW